MCMESKITKKSYKLVERESKPLSLIHNDLEDLKNIITKCGKRFYITFANDYSRYIRIYFLRNKDETTNVFIK